MCLAMLIFIKEADALQIYSSNPIRKGLFPFQVFGLVLTAPTVIAIIPSWRGTISTPDAFILSEISISTCFQHKMLPVNFS